MSESKPQPATPQRDNAPEATPKTQSKRPKLNMQELNPLFGAFCLLAAVGAFMTKAYPAAGALTCVGAAFLLYWRDMREWEQIPRWKRITVTTLIFIGGAFLIFYVISLGGY